MALHQLINARPFGGFVESVPAYSSLAIFYNTFEVLQINSARNSAFDYVKAHIENILSDVILDGAQKKNKIIEIPILYDGEDLEFVANQHQLSNDEVIAIHTSMTYRIFMIGFLPGFPYMGSVDERIATSRKSSPRTSVPAGSLGIAGVQTGIYPQPSPGGWQLIGRTPLKIFDQQKPSPCLFSPGDAVRFFAIDQNEFEKLNEY